MDLLSQRYASPFLLLDDAIRLGQLQEFVAEIFSTMAEEKKEQYRWEFYLHKVYDKTYSEYLNIINDEEKPSMTKEDIKNVVEESASVLDGFSLN